MNITMRKVLAITELKFRMLNNKNTLVAPIMSIGMVLLFRFIYSGIGMDAGFLTAMILNMGLSFSILMTGMYVTSATFAEEKEKHTLRTLMTSSVNSMEFFIGSIIPPFVVIMAVNVIVLLVSGIDLTLINFPVFILVTTIAAVTSCILGMLFGIFAKDQVSASTISMPGLLVFLMIPMLAPMNATMGKISGFLFSGVVNNMVEAFVAGEAYTLDALSLAVLLGEIAVSMVLFIVAYRKNGYEAD